MRSGVIVAMFTLLLVGCFSGVPDSRGFIKTHEFEIDAEGSKRFVFMIRLESRKGAAKLLRNYDAKRFIRYVDNHVDYFIKETGFCRGGYFVFDRIDHPETGYVKGECRDSATALDRERWGDSAISG